MNAKKLFVPGLALMMLLSTAAMGCSKTNAATSDPSIKVTGVVVGGGDTTLANGPTDAPRKYVYEVQKEDRTRVNVSYTGYPPSPVGDAARAKIALQFHDGEMEAGDYMEAFGTYDAASNTVTVAELGEYIKTYAQKP